MIGFLTKGLYRDKTRSLFPILIIAAGVMITVFLYSWIAGNINMVVYENARLETGHVKIVSRAYAELIDQKPFDLGFLGLDELMTDLHSDYPGLIWTPRTYFGGLLDLPDEAGETRSQGEVMGLGINLLTGDLEQELFQLDKALVAGRMLQQKGEILISSDVAAKLGAKLGDSVTLITSTIYGSMSLQNFTVVGLIRFGIQVMDKGAVIIDLTDCQTLLDLGDGTGEILGFLPNYDYDQTKIDKIKTDFNNRYSDPKDEFSPLMLSLRDQNNLDYYLASIESKLGLIVFIFIFIMSLVLWNAGLMNGIRRYGEIGVRLAIGESKGHIYGSLIWESLLIGVFGSIIGTAIGLAFSYYLEFKGIDISSMMKNVSMIMSTVMRAEVTPTCFYIGFVPGLFASVLGSMISGIGIYKRKTAQLFKELEQ